MKRYGMAFLFSFLSYPVALAAMPYMTARTWADACLLLLVPCLAYQLAYLLLLRKREGVSLGKALSRFFLHALQAVSLYIVILYLDMFFNGYHATTFTGQPVAVYHGLDAWTHNVFANLLCLPVLLLTAGYMAVLPLGKKRRESATG